MGNFHAVLFSAQNSSTVNEVQDVVLETHYGVFTWMELLDSGHIHWLCVVLASTIAAANEVVKKVIAVDAGKGE